MVATCWERRRPSSSEKHRLRSMPINICIPDICMYQCICIFVDTWQLSDLYNVRRYDIEHQAPGIQRGTGPLSVAELANLHVHTHQACRSSYPAKRRQTCTRAQRRPQPGQRVPVSSVQFGNCPSCTHTHTQTHTRTHARTHARACTHGRGHAHTRTHRTRQDDNQLPQLSRTCECAERLRCAQGPARCM